MTEDLEDLKRRLVVDRKRDGRCVYDEEAKAELVALCLKPDVSAARLARECGVNANQVSRWLREHGRGRCCTAVASPTPAPAAFVAVPVIRSTPAPARRDESTMAVMVVQACWRRPKTDNRGLRFASAPTAIDGNLYSIPDDEWPDDRPVLPDDWFTLDEVLGTTVRSFLHEYDFGDGWQHDVTVQAVELADEERNGWPICLAGANACQPEDVGRLGGYAEFLEAIDNPAYDGHAATWRWAGGPFDPRGFDINSANRAMRDWLSESR